MSESFRSPTWLWWLGLGMILLLGALTYFIGYNTDMPLLYNNIDERRNLYEVYVMRGLSDEDLTKPGYPPGILWVYHGAQLAVEATVGDTSFEHPGLVVIYVRVAAIITSLITAFYIGLVGRKLKGDVAGWVAALAWLSLPLVFERTVDGLPQTYEVMFYVSALYYAILAVEKAQARWALVSMALGLLCVIFKYTAFPVLGFGFFAVVWMAWKQPDQRSVWLRALAIQIAAIIATAFYLLEIYGVSGLISTEHPETNNFLDSGLFSLIDFQVVRFMFQTGLSQTGLAMAAFWVLLIVGSVIYWRQHTEDWRRLGYIGAAGLALFHLWFSASYVFYLYDTTRYTTPATSLLIVTQVVLIVSIAEWIAQRVKIPVLQYGIVAVIAVIWIAPQFLATWNFTRTRELQNTANGLVEWGMQTLPEGEDTLILSDSKNFDRGWGGYTGPVRPWVDDDLLAHSQSEWLDLYVYYAEITGFRRTALLKTEAGRERLDEMLLLKRFPPPGQETNWRGEYRYVYHLRGYQNETDVSFDDGINLIGYDLSADNVEAGDTLTVLPYWQAGQIPSADYQVFLHLTPLDTVDVSAQADSHPARNPGRVTSTWDDPHEILVGNYLSITLPDDIVGGEYRLLLGLYNPQTGQRLLTDSEQDFTVVQTIRVNEQVSVGEDASDAS